VRVLHDVTIDHSPLTMPTTPLPWLTHAFADLGLAAIPGPATEPRITQYYADAGHPEVTGDDVAWCAAFVGGCLSRADLPNTKSLLARSYLNYGAAISAPHPGAIAIFSRGSDPSFGHVAFVVGETSDALLVLGGNQSHAVSVIAMPRDRLLGLRWPLQSATQPQTSHDAAFDHALAHVLKMEGGYSNDPYDPGGATNLGITLVDLARYRGVAPTPDLDTAIKALTPAEVVPIYRAFYWGPSHAPQLPPALALFHFDAAVNHGLGAAARMLQQALGVDIDGDIGPLTLAAAASSDTATTLAAYADIRRARYRALSTFWRFGRGWLARVDATLAAALPLITAPRLQPNPTPPPPRKDLPMTDTSIPSTTAQPKWWGQSLTVWGTIVTTLATVLPIAGPLIGLEISADTVHQLGDGVVRVAQALGGVIGIAMTIYGRSRATQPLSRRDVMMRI
jgi:uncharacterized protein (TIGR02594 family)